MNDVLKEGLELVHLTGRTPADLQAKMIGVGAKRVINLQFSGKHSAYVLVEKKAVSTPKQESSAVDTKPESAPEQTEVSPESEGSAEGSSRSRKRN